MVQIAINYWAILACGVASMVLGFLWYGPLFGKKYMKYVGATAEDVARFKADPKAMRKMNINYGITFLVALLSAYILAHFLIFGSNFMSVSGEAAGLEVGFWAWLGFVVPSVLGGVFWERKAWGWFFLVSGYYLLQLLIMGVILAVWM